jgi:aldehyde dehydrogenase (NAD+)
VLETSDMPGGVINIVTGGREELTKTLAEHRGVEAIWYFGPNGKKVEAASADDLKRSWIGEPRDWLDGSSEGREFLRRATQVKNVWIPYGA